MVKDAELGSDVEAIITEMTARMRHRGPDGDGVWIDPTRSVILGHRRLAIVDLSEHGRQPMSYADGRIHIAFNGEIYNYVELSRELSERGHVFTSTGDTQVLLAAIAEWGLRGAVRRTVGMFAFALWDAFDRTLHLVRDRLGEKPLHYAAIDGTLYFASEVRAFSAIRRFSRSIDGAALASYFRFGYVPEPLSMFEGVRKLPAGTTLAIPACRGKALHERSPEGADHSSASGIEPERYWSCEEVAVQGLGQQLTDEHEASERLEHQLRDTVRQQMVCDVPIGCFLSGGIDSSLVTAVAQSESSTPIHTFTVRFDQPEFDESAHARAIARFLGTRHEEFELSGAAMALEIPNLISTLDEPTANGSYFAVQQISKLARTRATVVLSGDGGDELFAGYNRYALTRRTWAMARFLPPGLRASVQAGLGRMDGRVAGAAAAHVMSVLPLGSQASFDAAMAKLERVVGARSFRECYDLATSCWPHTTGWTGGTERERYWRSLPSLSAMLLSDQIDYLPGDSLAKLDRASMSASLETRLPLLDHRIVEFSWRTPEGMKLRRGKSKWLLRSVLNRLLPRTLTERKKMGFTVPVDSWLSGSLRGWASDMLSSAGFRQFMGDRHGDVMSSWKSYHDVRRPNGYQMWSLVVLAAWLQAQA